jgi:hypothetical protein
MNLSDIGVPSGMSGGETLAGTIRQERQTRRTGFARLKKKVKFWFDRLLPEYLEFKFIDLDDELNVAIGRARLATSTAWQQMITAGMFTPEEGRQQMIADGLITISVPEALPQEAKDRIEMQLNPPKVAERPTALGKPVSANQGGYGEVKSDFMLEPVRKVRTIDNTVLLRNVYRNFLYIRAEVELVSDALKGENLDAWDIWYDEVLDGIIEEVPQITVATLSNLRFDVKDYLDLRSELNIDLVRKEFVDFYNAVIEAKNKIAFVRGDVDIVPEVDKSHELDIASRDYAMEFIVYLQDAVQKGIISGTRKFVLDNPNILNPDELFNTNVLSYVQSAIDNYVGKTVRMFENRLENKISDIINKTIEGENENA